MWYSYYCMSQFNQVEREKGSENRPKRTPNLLRGNLRWAAGAIFAGLTAMACSQTVEAPDVLSNEGFIKPIPVITPVDTGLDWNRINAMEYALWSAKSNCGATLTIGDHDFAVAAYWVPRPLDDKEEYIEWLFTKGGVKSNSEKVFVRVKDNRTGQTYFAGTYSDNPGDGFKLNGSFFPEQVDTQNPYTVLLEDINKRVVAQVSPQEPKKC